MKTSIAEDELKTVVTQPRWKSRVLWAAIIAQVLVIFELTGLFKAWGLDIGVVEDGLTALLQLFAIFGIVNNPTNKKGL